MARDHQDNPYAPPRYQDDEGAPESDHDERQRRRFDPATLGERFVGAMVDGLVMFLLGYVLRVMLASSRGEPTGLMDLFGPAAAARMGFAEIVVGIMPLGIQAALIAQRAQSIGKIVMGTRIVTADGRRADLIKGFVLRTLPFTAVALFPSILIAAGAPPLGVAPLTYLTSLVSLVDAVMIFGTERRCLHDRLAGTYVAKVGTERPAEGEESAPRRKKKGKKRRKAADAEGDDAG